jgi:hypothetical protein
MHMHTQIQLDKHCRETMSSRVAASLISAVTQPLTIARTLDDYADLAYQLIGPAGRHRRLAAVRTRLGIDRKVAPLFDTRRLVGEVEGGVRMAWDSWTARGRGASDGRVDMHVVVNK